MCMQLLCRSLILLDNHAVSASCCMILCILNTYNECVQVLGCAKGVVATVVSVLLFRNQVTALGALGYFLTVVGVFAYSWAKRSAAKQ